MTTIFRVITLERPVEDWPTKTAKEVAANAKDISSKHTSTQIDSMFFFIELTWLELNKFINKDKSIYTNNSMCAWQDANIVVEIVDFCFADTLQLQTQLSSKPHVLKKKKEKNRKTAPLQFTTLTFVIFHSNKLKFLHIWAKCVTMATGPKCWGSHTSLNKLQLRREDGRFQMAEPALTLTCSLCTQRAERTRSNNLVKGCRFWPVFKCPGCAVICFRSRWNKTNISSWIFVWGLLQQQARKSKIYYSDACAHTSLTESICLKDLYIHFCSEIDTLTDISTEW